MIRPGFTHSSSLKDSVAASDCFACRGVFQTPIIRESPLWRVVVNRNQDLLGKVMIVLRRYEEHVAGLTEAEWAELLGEVQVIATDLFPELLPYIESGRILATLYQRPFSQGKTALEVLLRYLLHGEIADPITRLAPHIILRSNLSLFTGYLTDDATTNDK